MWESVEKKEGRDDPSLSPKTPEQPRAEPGITLRLGDGWQCSDADRTLLLGILNQLTRLMQTKPHDFRVILKDSGGAVSQPKSDGKANEESRSSDGAVTPQEPTSEFTDKVHLVLHSFYNHSWIYPVEGAADPTTYRQVMNLFGLLERVLGQSAGDRPSLTLQAVLCGHRIKAIPALMNLGKSKPRDRD